MIIKFCNVGINTTTQTLNVVGDYNLTQGGDKTITTNATCVLIYGPTSIFSIC